MMSDDDRIAMKHLLGVYGVRDVLKEVLDDISTSYNTTCDDSEKLTYLNIYNGLVTLIKLS